MPKFIVVAEIHIPLRIKIEADTAYLAEEKVTSLSTRDILRAVFGGAPVSIDVDGIDEVPE